MSFLCNGVIPVGASIVRDFDANDCIVAQKVFLFRYGHDVYGTTHLKTLPDFLKYIDAACRCCSECDSFVLTINNCAFTINGCQLAFGEKCDSQELGINGCNLLINGCNLNFN